VPLLFASEWALRFTFREAVSSADARTFLARQSVQPHTNGLGYRSHDIRPKTAAYRIAVVGDSITWGQGVQDGERFSDRLEASLGQGYDVYNFGKAGNDMWNHIEALDTVVGVSPDFVLLQLAVNDFETLGMVRPPRARPLLPWPTIHERLLASSLLYGILDNQWDSIQVGSGMTESYSHYMARYLGDSSSPAHQNAFRMLRDFIHRTRAAGIPTGIVFFPSPEPLDDRYPFTYLHQSTSDLCIEEQIHCVDLRPPFAASFPDPSVMWVNRFDHHPSARAHTIAAAAIRSEFENVWR
jgi:lysophospholipase L1-like esterase